MDYKILEIDLRTDTKQHTMKYEPKEILKNKRQCAH
jgi:hypothetical protein